MEELIKKEVEIWAGLLGNFTQKELVELVHQYLLQHNKKISENKVRTVVKAMLKAHGLSYMSKYQGYKFPDNQSIRILARISHGELEEHLMFYFETFSYDDNVEQMYGRAYFFLIKKNISSMLVPFIYDIEKYYHNEFMYYAIKLGYGLLDDHELVNYMLPEWVYLVGEELFFYALFGDDDKIFKWYEAVQQRTHKNEALIWLLCQIAFFNLDLEKLDLFVMELSTLWRKLCIKTLLLFYKNEPWQEMYKMTEEEYCRVTNKRTFTPDGPLALLVPFMLWSTEDFAMRKKARLMWQRIRKEKFSFTWDEMNAFHALLENNLGNMYFSLFYGGYVNYSTAVLIFLTWYFFYEYEDFMDLKKDKKCKAFAKYMLSKAIELEKKGAKLWALEIFAFLAKGFKNTRSQSSLRRFTRSTEFYPLWGRFREKETWEIKLSSLEKYVNEHLNLEEKKKFRLVWFLRFMEDSIGITPKEQKLRANGTWSDGRSVSLKKLYEGQYKLLSEHDRAVVKCIKYSPVHRTWNSSKNYVVTQDIMFALIGHPYVFDEDTREQLDVVEGKVRLSVTTDNNNLKITLDPFFVPDSEKKFHLVKEGNKVRVYKLDKELHAIVQILGKNGVKVPAKEKARIQNLLKALSHKFPVEGTSIVPAREVPPDTTINLILKPLKEGLLLTVRVFPLGEQGPRYIPGDGPEYVSAVIQEENLKTQRQLTRENELFSHLLNGLFEIDGLEARQSAEWHAPDLVCALNLLEFLEGLDQKDYRLLWPEGKSFNLVHMDKEIDLNLSQGKDWFTVDGEVKIENKNISLPKLLSQINKQKNRFLPLDKGKFLVLKERVFRQLNELAEIAEIKANSIRLSPLRTLVLWESGWRMQEDKEVQEFKKKINDAFNLDPKVPRTLKNILRPYQVEGFKWMRRLYEAGLGACLADDMGLGKTLQSLSLLLAIADNGPSLIVAPASVLSVWEDEINRFTPELKSISLAPIKDRKDVLKKLKPYQVVLVSYGLLQQRETASLLKEKSWSMVVLDEAQQIKNYRAIRAKSAFGLQARFRLATTGTPLENRLEELWTIFRFLNPGLLGSLEDFRRRFVTPIEKEQQTGVKKRLKRLIGPFILRRTKAEVLTELPPRTESVLYLDFSPEEAALYEAVRQEALTELEGAKAEVVRFKILQYLTKLRLLCCSPKLLGAAEDAPETKVTALLELLDELVSAGHRILVFSQFVQFLKRIEQGMQEKGWSWLYLDGSVPTAERAKRVKTFQEGKASVFLISLRAGGFGLNLTAASYVVLADPWWNPAVEAQAADRVHRPGQTQPVTIYRLIVKNTVEEKVRVLQQEKTQRLEEILEGTSSPAALSLDEWVELLK